MTLYKALPSNQTDIPSAPSLWCAQAKTIVSAAHRQLLLDDELTETLFHRGIGDEVIKRFRLGCLREDIFQDRKAWGLQPEIKETGKPRRLCLPAGLVVPMMHDDQVGRVRIRRAAGDRRYYLVPGSSTDTWKAPCELPEPAAAVVVASELDAMACASAMRDVHVIALLDCAVWPDIEAQRLLMSAPVVLVPLDHNHTAARTMRQWGAFSLHKRIVTCPPPLGSDPGEAAIQGLSLGDWLKSTLDKI